MGYTPRRARPSEKASSGRSQRSGSAWPGWRAIPGGPDSPQCLARRMPFWRESRSRGEGCALEVLHPLGGFSSPCPNPAFRKIVSDQSRRRTAYRASESATIDFSDRLILPRPGGRRHRVVHQGYDRVQAEQKWSRPHRGPPPPAQRRPGSQWVGLSWNVPSRFQRPAYRVAIVATPIRESVVEKHSSWCVPARSWRNTRRIGTGPLPALYQCPVPVVTSTRRVLPLYQPIVSRRRRPAAATPSRGLGRRPSWPRGRPRPRYGEDGSCPIGLRVRLADKRQPFTVPGVGVRGADRVAVAGLAVVVLAGMSVDRLITDQEHRPLGHEPLQEPAGQDAPDLQARPAQNPGPRPRRDGSPSPRRPPDPRQWLCTARLERPCYFVFRLFKYVTNCRWF